MTGSLALLSFVTGLGAAIVGLVVVVIGATVVGLAVRYQP